MLARPFSPVPQSVADILDQCGSSFTAELVDDDAATALRAACTRLPALLTTFWGVESRLGDVRPEVDLSIEIKRGLPGHALLAGEFGGRNDAAELAARLPAIDRIATGPAWPAVRTFARHWLEPADALHDGVRNIWLEFDLVAAARAGRVDDAIERPSIFWGLDIESPLSTAALIEAIARAYPAFPADAPLDVVGRVLDSLPEGARVFQVGAMDMRGDVRLRLCIGSLAPAAIPGWLTSVGWQGDGPALDALDVLIRRIGPLVTRVAVALDVTRTGLGPKVGLECYQTWGNADSAQWSTFLDVLDAEGLITAGKRVAVDAFPATTRYSSIEQQQRRDDHYIFPVLVRDVHHIKLGFEGGRVTEAKAYLGVHRPGVNMLSTVTPGDDPWLTR